MDKNKPYSHRSKEQWQLLFKEHQISGLNIRQFCQKHNLPVSNFYAWRKKLSDDAALVSQEEASFVQLDLTAESLTKPEISSPRQTWAAELQIGSHITLRISH